MAFSFYGILIPRLDAFIFLRRDEIIYSDRIEENGDDYVIYNRGYGGYVMTQLMEVMDTAVFADVGVAVIAILNAGRMLAGKRD